MQLVLWQCIAQHLCMKPLICSSSFCLPVSPLRALVKCRQVVCLTSTCLHPKQCASRLNVTAFQCKTCGTTSERRRPDCRQHDVQRVTATKRWWHCCHCNNRFSTVAVRLPKERCPKYVSPHGLSCRTWECLQCLQLHMASITTAAGKPLQLHA